MLIGLCLLLVAVQAVLPRDMVLCLHDNGGAAIELSHHGRCLGQTGGDAASCTAALLGVAAADAVWSVNDADCRDLPVLTADGRSTPQLRLPAPDVSAAVPSLAPPAPRGWAAASTALQRSPAPSLHPALLLTTCVVLRI